MFCVFYKNRAIYNYFNIGVSLLIAIIIAGSIMLGLSFSIVDEDEYALRFNMATHEFSKEIDESGRHFVGLGRFHVNFPRRYVTITFAQGGDVFFLETVVKIFKNSTRNYHVGLVPDKVFILICHLIFGLLKKNFLIFILSILFIMHKNSVDMERIGSHLL